MPDDDDDLREHLDDLAEDLQQYEGQGRDEALALLGRLRAVLDPEEEDESDADLMERIETAAVEFESEHPRLTQVLRRAADSLAATGL